MGILKVAMRLALDHGTKPNELINVAVEGGNQCPTRITLFNFIRGVQESKSITEAGCFPGRAAKEEGQNNSCKGRTKT